MNNNFTNSVFVIQRFGVQEGDDPVLLGGIDLKRPIVRIGGLIFIFALQLWLLMTFLKYQRGRKTESKVSTAVLSSKKHTKQTSPRSKNKKGN